MEKDSLGRDKDFHADLSKQNMVIEGRKVISIYPSRLAMHWTLVANMQREFRLSLSGQLGQEYLLTTTEYIDSEFILSHYKRIPPFNTKRYVFFKLHD
jgi:hypothetical protein